MPRLCHRANAMNYEDVKPHLVEIWGIEPQTFHKLSLRNGVGGSVAVTVA